MKFTISLISAALCFLSQLVEYLCKLLVTNIQSSPEAISLRLFMNWISVIVETLRSYVLLEMPL